MNRGEIMENEVGRMEPWGDQTNVVPMFRVSFSKEARTFTLIQEEIVLTEEQAMQIYSAYKQQIDLIGS